MILTEKDLQDLCQTAADAAISAGKYIQSQFDQHYTTSRKESGDSLASQVVTAVDLRAQEIILEHLESTFEEFDLGLLTEEAIDNHSRAEKPYFWCIDPMDGTLPFTEGRTGYAVSIALVANTGNPVIGVVYLPDTKACYTAIKGAGLRLNNQPFVREENENDDTLHVYMDRSLQAETYFEKVSKQLKVWTNQKDLQIQYHTGYGAVFNALGVLNSKSGCYFKFAKQNKGGGSIWDFAATTLFFKELGLRITDSFGQPLHLNNPNTTFMNESGVIYSTDSELTDYIVEFGLSFR